MINSHISSISPTLNLSCFQSRTSAGEKEEERGEVQVIVGWNRGVSKALKAFICF